ncbi:MAG: hypothetical protein ACI9U2_001294 [Bradymonadia bacterium]
MNRLKSLLLFLRPVGILLLWALGVLFVVQAAHGPETPTTGGTLLFSADFTDGALNGWSQGTPDPGWDKGAWTVRGGRLHAEKIHNAALWLDRPLPAKVRIEFDARALSEKGDVKCEVFGDGRTHQSGYILIHGGWDNQITTLARQDEHGEDRKVDNRDCARPGGRPVCVEPNLDYHWVVERTGDDVKWFLDGRLQLVYRDPHPVEGAHFAFNNWEAPVSFDNLKIFDLSSN